jgi:hypothetical protein
MRALKGIHILVGVFGIIAFVLTGQYLSIFLGGLVGMPDGPRLLYRTSHLYLMWSSLVNFVVGSYFLIATTRGARVVQIISSVALLLGPPLMLAAFFFQSRAPDLNRPVSDIANYLGLGGVILHVAATHLGRFVKREGR